MRKKSGRRYNSLRRLKLRQLEDKPERHEGFWNISLIVSERIRCVQDLARLLVALGTLDVDEALARIEVLKAVEAERPY